MIENNNLYQGQICEGYQNLTVSAVSSNLSLPTGKKIFSALIVLEPNPLAVSGAVLARFLECSANIQVVNSNEGIPLLAYTNYIVRFGTLTDFQIISADGLDHSLKVQYFG